MYRFSARDCAVIASILTAYCIFGTSKPISGWWKALRKLWLRIPVVLSVLVLAVSTVWAQSLTVTAPAALTIHPGDQKVPLAVSLGSSDYTGPISITLTGLPSGVTVTPLSLAAGSSGSLLVSASVSADREAFPANNAAGPNSATRAVTVVAAAGTLQATAPLTLTILLSNPSFAPTPDQINLPIVRIDTGGTPITSTETSVSGTITITSADGKTTYLPNASDSDNTATFHVHGNSTAEMQKKPYNIKLKTSLDLLSTMGLYCPYNKDPSQSTCDKSKSYILLANYDDKTLLHDWAASALANAIPMGGDYLSSASGSPSPSKSAQLPWAPHSLFVELYLNGQYEGNYQLIEKVNVDSHRINISELSESDTGSGGNDITGGYFLEIDHRKDEAYVFTTPQGVPIGLQDPDFSPDPEVPAQTDYISDYVNTAENALFSTNFTDPATGWRAYFDEAALVNYYLVNDIMGNVDGGDFYSSVYLYKDKDNPLLYMGPIWDFDVAAGNVNYHEVSSPVVPWTQKYSPWYKQLFQDPDFKADVAKQFNALKNNGVLAAWLTSVSSQAAALEQSQKNNFARWPMIGIPVWPNPEVAGSYDGEVAYMLTYLNARIGYLDSVLNSRQQTTAALTLSPSSAQAGTPVTLTASITGGTAPSGTVTFLVANHGPGPTATLGADGSGVATIGNLPPGSYSISAIYNGDGNNALSISPAVALTITPAPIQTTTTISGPASANGGDSVTFQVSVLATSGVGIPTGTVSFTVGGKSLNTVALGTDGTTTFSTTALPGGSDAIKAIYNGDANYQSSPSPVLTVTVASSELTPPLTNPTFTLTGEQATASSADVSGSEVFNLTVTPQNGFDQPITFSCSGAPAGYACSFSPATVTPGVAPVNVTLTIAKSGTATARRHAPASPWKKFAGGIALALLLWPFARRRGWQLAAVLLVVAAGLTMTACGSGGSSGGPYPVPSTLVVTGTGGGVTQSTTLLLLLDR